MCGSYYSFNGRYQCEYNVMMDYARQGKWQFSKATCDALKTYYRFYLNGNCPDKYNTSEYAALCESIADTHISIEWKRFKEKIGAKYGEY